MKLKEDVVMIRVRYPDGKIRSVSTAQLAQLIKEKRICEFFRDNGWVRLGIDPVRRYHSSQYHGPERRETDRF